jgi:predicted acetyltransferase
MWQSRPEIVHPVPEEASEGFARAMATAFLSDPDWPDEARLETVRRQWNPARTWGVRDDGRWVATLRTLERTLTVPGHDGATRVIPADAITAVTVAATHRRRGLMSAMLGDALAAAREREDPVSILVAAEWPIYGRLGYAPAIFGARYTFHTRRRGATLAADATRVRQVDPEVFGAVAPGIFEAFRRGRAGQVDRPGSWWDATIGLGGWPTPRDAAHNWLLHEGPDGPDGLLAWRAEAPFGFLPPLGAVGVPLLAAVDDAAYRDLWAYLSGLDGVEEVRLIERPIDEPVRWLLDDARTLVATEQRDQLWLRLLDVPAALAARRYAIPGEVVLEVRDEGVRTREQLITVAGRYRLRADGDEVVCEPTADPPDLTLDERVLAGIYLGGCRLAELAITGGVHEHMPGAVARTQTMFSTPLTPWNATRF